MRRGIIRIISGSALMLLQILSIIGQSQSDTNIDPDVWFNIGFLVGFFGTGVTGVCLLVAGIRVYQSGARSTLVLHRCGKRHHAILKWIGIAVSVIFAVTCVANAASDWPDRNLFALLTLLSSLSFAVYSICYLYKKPSVLFSAALIFMGVARIWNAYQMQPFGPEFNTFFVLYYGTGVVPRFVTGIIWIIGAVIIYKERFLIRTVKTLGWILLVLEIFSTLIFPVVILDSLDFIDVLLFLANPGVLYIVVLTLYMVAIEVNTLKDMSAFHKNTFTQVDYEADVISKVEDLSSQVEHIQFCRRCGSRIFDDSRFCSKCGTQIAKE